MNETLYPQHATLPVVSIQAALNSICMEYTIGRMLAEQLRAARGQSIQIQRVVVDMELGR